MHWPVARHEDIHEEMELALRDVVAQLTMLDEVPEHDKRSRVHRRLPRRVRFRTRPLGIAVKHSRPYHPQTCGKIERFHQTVKHFLAKQHPPASIRTLEAQLDHFVDYYNNVRPHRAINRRTPNDAFNARTKARPQLTPTTIDGYRLRHDTVDGYGKITLRHKGRLHHIGLGRTHAVKTVAVLVAGRNIRVLSTDGTLIRELELDPARDYQPQHH